MSTERGRRKWLLSNGFIPSEAEKWAKSKLPESVKMRVTIKRQTGEDVPPSFDGQYNEIGAKGRNRFIRWLEQGCHWEEALFRAANPQKIFRAGLSAPDLQGFSFPDSLRIKSLIVSGFTKYEALKIFCEGFGEELDGTFPVRIAHRLFPKKRLSKEQSAAAFSVIMRKRKKEQLQLRFKTIALRHFDIDGYFMIPCSDESSAELLTQMVPQLEERLWKVIKRKKAEKYTARRRTPLAPFPVQQMNQQVDCEYFSDPIINSIVGSYINGDEVDQCADSVSKMYRNAFNVSNDQFKPSRVPSRPVTINTNDRYEESRDVSVFSNDQRVTTTNDGRNRFNPYGMIRNNGDGGGEHQGAGANPYFGKTNSGVGNNSCLARNLFNL